MNFRNVLKTEHLNLRPFSQNDWQAVHSWASNPENVRFMTFGPNTEEETKAFINTTTPGEDFIVERDGKAIGSCGIYFDYGGDTGELGWLLHIDHHGQGLGTEICRELLRYGFEDIGLRRIIATCAAENHGSYRIMEKNKMRREAVHIKSRFGRIDNIWLDELLYAILAEEYVSNGGK
ncbi:MAG: GNAT family N-acetyltransferase [Defluviitaleaceae bacterium]|nr:GNAT family N-acetyltransferase [Defluviitaleaceae bacterium]